MKQVWLVMSRRGVQIAHAFSTNDAPISVCETIRNVDVMTIALANDRRCKRCVKKGAK